MVDALSAEGVRKVEKGDVRGASVDGGRLEGDGELVGAKPDEAGESVHSGGKSVVPDDVAVWGLRGCSP